MVKDFLRVYKKTLEQTYTAIKRSPQVLVVPVIASIIFGLLTSIAYRLGLLNNRFSYLLTNLLYSIVLSGMYFQYERAINYNSLTPYNILDGLEMYVIDIYFVRFILYIVSIFITMIIPSLRLSNIILSVLYIVLNPVSEMIYIRRGTGSLGDFRFLIDFIKDNWYLWIPHMAIYLVIYYVLFGTIANPIGMYLVNNLDVGRIDIKIIGLKILLSIYLVFRGVMFKMIYSSSKRTREFQEMI